MLLDEIGSEVQDHRRFPLTRVSHFILFQIGNRALRGLCKTPVGCEQKQQVFSFAVMLPSFKHCLTPGNIVAAMPVDHHDTAESVRYEVVYETHQHVDFPGTVSAEPRLE